MPVAPRYWTADMVLALPDDGMRHEVVWGEHFVNPAPDVRHQRIVVALFEPLVAYCRRFDLGEAFNVAGDIRLAPHTLVQPDIFVVDPIHKGVTSWKSVRALRLAVEVLSPSTERLDRFGKRSAYQASGVGNIWLVDPVERCVEVWTTTAIEPAIETRRLVWHPAGASEPLVIELNAVFGPAQG